MLLADFLFLVIVVYLAYRFIFNFLLPIVRATHQVRQQFRNMGGANDFGGGTRSSEDSGGSDAGGARPDAGARPSGGTRPDAGGAARPSGGARPDAGGAARPGSGGGKGSYKPPAEDYIDFEEVK
jgi:hypothetical protein